MTNDTDAHRELQRKFVGRFPDYFNAACGDSINPFFITWDDMITISGKLKEGKSTNSFITAEHILYGSPKLAVHLHILFNSFLQHSFVLIDFLKGTISPVIACT